MHGPYAVERHGLVAGGGEVDNGKPLVSQTDLAVSVDINTLVVGTPVAERVPHRLEQARIDRISEFPNADYSAHAYTNVTVNSPFLTINRSSQLF